MRLAPKFAPGFSLWLAPMLLLAMLAPAAVAKTTDRNAPMDISSDRSDAVLDDDSDSVLEGNVRITQGTLDVSADRAVIQRRGGEITQIILTGSPAVLKQLSDANEPMTANARKIDYSMTSDVVLLTGSVVIEQPRGNMRGETIRYDLSTGRLQGGDPGNRVHMRILPKNTAGGAN